MITPDGRDRIKNEEVPEKAIITKLNFADTENKPKRSIGVVTRRASINSAGSLEEHPLKANSPDTASATTNRTRGKVKGAGYSTESSESSKKRKSNRSNNANAHSPKSRKVTFQISGSPKKEKAIQVRSLNGVTTSTYGTRSAQSNGTGSLMELPAVTKTKHISTFKVPKVKKNEKVEVVKMLTGTLYLYRGEHRRAEFIRSR